jgi:aldehyde oxidoreductase
MPVTANLILKQARAHRFESDVQNIQMVEIEVNTDTGDARVIKLTSAIDSGPIINPQAWQGQIEGGMDQGVGYALREEYIAGKTKDWVTFKFPKITNSFDMEILPLETPRWNGTLKGTES